MKVKFQSIAVDDCFAYQHLHFDFTTGVHSINGINGASKTSIYLALAQGLFNKNPKGVKIEDVSNIITKQPYRITIRFTKGNDSYVVVNSRKTGTITVERNGMSLTKKTIPMNLELIREVLEDTYESFIAMTYQSTESTLDLVEEASDTARKGFINRILKFDELDELLTESKDKLKQLKLLAKTKTAQLDSLSNNLLPIREVGELIDLTELELEITRLEEEKKQHELKLVELEKEHRIATNKAYAYVEYTVKLEKYEKLKKLIEGIKLPSESAESLKDKLSVLDASSAEHKVVVKNAKSKLNSLKEPETVCSRCGHSVGADDALAIYKADLKEATGSIEESTKRIKELDGEIWYISELLDDWHKYNKFTQELFQIDLSNPPEKFTPMEADAIKDKLDLEKLRSRDLAAADVAKTKALAEAKGKNDLVGMVVKFNKEASGNNRRVTLQMDQLRKELEDIDRRMSLVDNWIRILGSNGYRVHKMNKFLQVLNMLMLKYSNIISGGKIRCSFYVTDEGKIELNVVDADKSVPFSSWSAGEKSRVKLACLFAVLEVLELMGSASYNVLFLDEVFATLDEGGREGLFEVLAHLKSTGKCIYTVSHTPIVNNVVFDSAIQLVKENGLSKIV